MAYWSIAINRSLVEYLDGGLFIRLAGNSESYIEKDCDREGKWLEIEKNDSGSNVIWIGKWKVLVSKLRVQEFHNRRYH